jgi:calcium-dependent protein kinase
MQVIAESLSEEEIGGLKELFKMIDTDNSGTITFDELKDGLKRVGSELTENEIQALMEAVSASSIFTKFIHNSL